MIIYLINIGLITFYALCLLYTKKTSDKKRKLFIVLSSFNWIVLSGLRHVSVGADTLAYKISFENSFEVSWQEAFNRLILYFKGVTITKDPGYLIFEKICGLVTNKYQIFLLIIAIIFFVLFGMFIYKNSKDPYISYLLFSCLFYSFFAITGHRQTLATSIAVFIGYELIKKKKIVLFIATVLIASLLHKSALLFLVMYPLYYVKYTSKISVISLILIICSFVFRYQLSFLFKYVSGYTDYGINNVNIGTFTILLFMVWLVSFVFRKVLICNDDKSKEINHNIIAVTMATFLCPLILINPSAMRAVQYFSLFLMFLVPQYIEMFDYKQRWIIKLLFCIVLILLFIKSGSRYLFFWQTT